MSTFAMQKKIYENSLELIRQDNATVRLSLIVKLWRKILWRNPLVVQTEDMGPGIIIIHPTPQGSPLKQKLSVKVGCSTKYLFL